MVSTAGIITTNEEKAGQIVAMPINYWHCALLLLPRIVEWIQKH